MIFNVYCLTILKPNIINLQLRHQLEQTSFICSLLEFRLVETRSPW